MTGSLQAAAFVALVLSFAPACQSEQVGVETICSICSRTEFRRLDPATRMQAMSKRLDAEVSNEDARALLVALANAEPEKKSALLREAAKRLGLEHCDMATYLDVGVLQTELATVLGEFFERVREKFKDQTAVLKVLERSCERLRDKGPDPVATHDGFAADVIETHRLGMDACFASLMQAANNHGVRDNYIALMPASASSKATQIYGAMTALVTR